MLGHSVQFSQSVLYEELLAAISRYCIFKNAWCDCLLFLLILIFLKKVQQTKFVSSFVLSTQVLTLLPISMLTDRKPKQ